MNVGYILENWKIKELIEVCFFLIEHHFFNPKSPVIYFYKMTTPLT